MTTTVLYRIRDWDEHYENARTRQYKTLGFVTMPNRYDSDKMLDLLEHDDGLAVFGCFVLLVEVASKCEPRGDLMRDSKRPHDAQSLSRLLRVDTKAITRTLEVLSNEPFTWFEAAVYMPCTEPPCTAAVQDAYRSRQKMDAELNRIEMNRSCAELPAFAENSTPNKPTVIWIPLVGNNGEHGITQAMVDEWKVAYPAVDILAELRKIRTWCLANPANCKTKRGVARFVNGWLSREQDRARRPAASVPGEKVINGSIHHTKVVL